MEQWPESEQSPQSTDSQILDSKLGEIENISYEQLTPEQSKEILKQTKIHGSKLDDQKLKVGDLRAAGLEPKVRIRFGDKVEWSASASYELAKGEYRAVVVYVRIDNTIVARSFYQSNSQLVWRYLPDYLSIEGNVGFFGKWISEYAITGPFAAQQVLARVQKEKSLQVKDSMRIFMGTARFLGEEKGTIVGVVGATPEKLEPDAEGYYRSHGTADRRTPETVGALPQKQLPNFSDEPLARWETSNKLYGRVLCEVFPSQDKTLRFLFCRDTLGRAWIASIENDSPVQSVGVRQKWIDAGDLTTPAYEYAEQSGQYGNYDLKKGHYVDMFSNYLVHMPIIRNYLQYALRTSTNEKSKEKIARNLIHSVQTVEQLVAVIRSLPASEADPEFNERVVAVIGMLQIGQAERNHLSSKYGIRKKFFSLLATERQSRRRTSHGLETNNG